MPNPTDTLADYLPVLVQITLAIVTAIVIVVASRFFGQRARATATKDSAYECGLVADGKPHPRFSVKFYIVAMLFIVFDIEVVFLIPWVLIYRDFLAQNIPVLVPALVFIGILILGLVYEMKKGALEWEK